MSWHIRTETLAPFVEELRDFLSEQADAEYFTDSPAPQPNEAMRLLTELNELFPEGKS